MPLYRYDCQACEQTIEILQRSGEPDRRVCGGDCALDWGAAMGRGQVQRRLSLNADHRVGGSRQASTNAGNPDACQSCGHMD